MAAGKVVAICIAPAAGEPMRLVEEVRALTGQGLEGDRYCTGEGSFSKGAQGKRQVTLINSIFFPGTGFEYVDSRRNIITEGVELMWLIGRTFRVGEAILIGVKYCDPCERPANLADKKHRSFAEAFHDRGGLVAEVMIRGIIRVNDMIIPPPKGY